MEHLCKICKIKHNKLIPYCSLECINNDSEFHEICRTANSKADAARKLGISITTFKTILKKLNITIISKKKEKIIPVKVCPNCSKEHTNKIYCSYSCSNAARIISEKTKKKMSESKKKHKIIKICPKCGKEHTNKIYCSNSCSASSKVVSEYTRKKMSESKKKNPVKFCPKCGKEHTNAVYCSITCANTNRTYSEETKKKRSETMKKHYESIENRKKTSKTLKEFYKSEKSEETKKKRSEIMKKYYEDHPEKLKTKEQKKAAQFARVAARRARKLNAFSPDADHKLLAKIREHCPEGYHVDHIIPISKGGLEHQDNLQYLPASENIRKGARLDYVPQGAIRWQDVVPQ